MKPGAKRSEQAQIYTLMLQGFSAKQISKQIKVYPDTVEKFMKAFEKDPKKVPRSARMEKVKEGMPEIKGMNNIQAVQAIVQEGKNENIALQNRVAELEAAMAEMRSAAPPNTGDTKDVFDGE